MKRSAMVEEMTNQMTAGGVPEFVARRVAMRQVELLDKYLAWEPEAPEWPALVRVRTDAGTMLDAVAPEDIGMSDANADRIAGAWNARRPGGEVERQIRYVIGDLRGRGHYENHLADRIEAALRLGVQGG